MATPNSPLPVLPDLSRVVDGLQQVTKAINNLAVTTAAAAGIPAATQSQPANPTAPASTAAFAMQGLAGSITPGKTGSVLVVMSGNIISSVVTAGVGIKLQLSHGIGAAPANAAALTGTQIGAVIEYTNPATVIAADVFIPFTVSAVLTGLSLGIAHWLDLAAEAVTTANDVGLANVSISAIEN